MLILLALFIAVLWLVAVRVQRLPWHYGRKIGLGTAASTLVLVMAPHTHAGGPDGRLEAEADGVGFSASLSALYQFSEDTRVGRSFRSESDSNLDTTLDFKNVIRPPGVIEELEGNTMTTTRSPWTFPTTGYEWDVELTPG